MENRTRPTIALCVIAKNEESNIRRMLESVKGCFDEVHVTDTGSTDKTVEVARELGAEVHHFEWIRDFSAARNYSYSHAKTDFVCWLDCDDTLDDAASFIEWRDTVMESADFWAVMYNYAHDVHGNVMCSFPRERVTRVNRGLHWQYFIHEGIVPFSTVADVKQNITQKWKVKHHRTSEDLEADKGRNINIFEYQLLKGTTFDARMKYYYSKELFEAGKPAEALKVACQVMGDKSLEFHDRVLCMQYAAFSAMTIKDFQKAMEICQMAVCLTPHRAEFWCTLGDIHIENKALFDAIPFFEAAKKCIPSERIGRINPIFTSKLLYGNYPMIQLAKIYANLQNIDKAKEELTECQSLYKDEESAKVLQEVTAFRGKAESYVKATNKTDEIIFTCFNSVYEWDGKKYREQAMGGSETACIEIAEWLAKLTGKKIKVFNQRKEALSFNGVEYLNIDDMNDYFAVNIPKLHISWRHNFKITDAPTLVWSHDLMTPNAHITSNYIKIMCLTPWHRSFCHHTQAVPIDKIFVTRNGIDPHKYADGPWEKDPFKFVFSSSPDRGLDRAMRVLDKVRLEFPEIKLHVFYGIEHLDKYGLGDLRVKLKKMMDERSDWVIYHGSVDQSILVDHFKTAAFNVQPADFLETSKISAIEQLCAGVYQITRSVGGVQDTLKLAHNEGMAKLITSDCVTEREYQVYIDATLQAVRERAFERVQVDANDYSWEKVARSWLDELPRLAGIEL